MKVNTISAQLRLPNQALLFNSPGKMSPVSG